MFLSQVGNIKVFYSAKLFSKDWIDLNKRYYVPRTWFFARDCHNICAQLRFHFTTYTLLARIARHLHALSHGQKITIMACPDLFLPQSFKNNHKTKQQKNNLSDLVFRYRNITCMNFQKVSRNSMPHTQETRSKAFIQFSPELMPVRTQHAAQTKQDNYLKSKFIDWSRHLGNDKRQIQLVFCRRLGNGRPLNTLVTSWNCHSATHRYIAFEGLPSCHKLSKTWSCLG